MSDTIDRRIVEMQFDNKQFEKGIKTSLNSLEELRKGLNLDGMAKSLDMISSRFSTMGIAGMTVIQDITRSVTRAGKQLVDSLYIDPARTGFNEYETQMNAVQTILANTSKDGVGIAKVNQMLDELNAYADKTIYNFSEMTRNIGTFTAAGVDIDTSVSAIKGIANLAAVSGSNSQQASTAMYQLSQAIAAGSVKLMDWNSVVNAGMGGEVFQDALKRTAKLMRKTLPKEAREMFDELEKGSISFRESLSAGWITSDILTATLETFTGDMTEDQLLKLGYSNAEVQEILKMGQTAEDAATKVKTLTQLFDTLKEAMGSGWAQSWEWIVGDFEEAKELFTSISDYFSESISKAAESRNTMLQNWKYMGGRQALIDSFWNIVEAISNVKNAISEAFQEIFPPMNALQLTNMTYSLKYFTEGIKALTENATIMGRVKSIVSGVAKVLSFFIGIAKTAIDGLGGLTESIVTFFSSLEKEKDILNPFVGTMERLNQLWQTMKNSAKTLRDSFVGLFSKEEAENAEELTENVSILTKVSGILVKLGNGFKTFIGGIDSAIQSLTTFCTTTIQSIKNSDRFKKATEKIGKAFRSIRSSVTEFVMLAKEAIKAFFADDTGSEDVTFTEKLSKRFETFKNVFAGWYEGLTTGATETYERIKGFFSNFFTNTLPGLFDTMSGWCSKLLSYAGNIDIAKVFGTISKVLWGIRLAALVDNIVGITGSIRDLGKNLKKTLKTLGDTIKDIGKDGLGNTILKMVGAIALLVGSLWVISQMDTVSIVTALGVIGILATEMLAFVAAFKLIGSDGAKSFKNMGVAVALLTIPIMILGNMDVGKAIQGIAGIGVVLLELAAFMALTKGAGFEGNTAFLSMAVAVGALALAIHGIGKLSGGDLAKGLLGITVLMTTLTGFMKKSAGFGKISGMIGMSVALGAITMVMKEIGKMDYTTLFKGVGAIAGMLTVITTISKGASGADFTKSILMLATTAGAMFIFLEAFKRIKDIDETSIMAFSGSMSAIMLAMSGSIKLLESVTIGGALLGVVKIGLIVAAIAGMMAGIGALVDSFDEGGEGVINGIEVFGDILAAVSGAVGKFIGGFGEGLSASFATIGTNLSSFMTNLQPFLDGIKGVGEDVLNGTLNLTGALLAITASEVITGITNLISGGNLMSSFSTNIGTLASGLSTFATNLGGFDDVDEDSLNNAIKVAEKLVELNGKLPAEGGLAGLLGVPDLSSFSERIPGLATALMSFATSITGFATVPEKGDIDNAISLAEDLVKLNEKLPAEGGVLQKLTGVPDLTSFSAAIPGFANGLKAFAESITGFTKTPEKNDIENALTLAESLVDLNSKLPEENGMLQRLTGVPDLSGFSEKIPVLATALKDFATNISGFTKTPEQGDMDNALALMGHLTTFANAIPAQDGWYQKIVGVKDVGSFASNIESLGSTLKSFSTNVTGIQATNTEGALTSLDLLQSFANQLDIETTFFEWLTGEDEVSKFKTQLETLGDGLSSFGAKVSSTNITDIQSVVDVMQGIVDLATSASGVNFEDFYLFDGFFTMFSSTAYLASWSEAATSIVGAFITPLQNGMQTGMISAVNRVGSLGATGIRSYYNGFYNAGYYLASGFSSGIRSGSSSAITAASAMAAGALNAVTTTIDAHSPARETIKLGGNFVDGFANALYKYAYKVNDGATSLGEGALESTKLIVNRYLDSLLSGIDTTPTIRPVVDTSGIVSGIQSINGMFGGRTISFGSTFNRHVNAISSGNSGSNKDVVNAIQALNSKFDHLNQVMNNMKIVLDDGTLVGHMASGMDKQLGVLAGRRERGN